MRLAVLSDIHANLPALEAVLADVERAGVSKLWCLGDVVGYGAQPDECTSLVAERCELCLVGNHDLAVLGELDTWEHTARFHRVAYDVERAASAIVAAGLPRRLADRLQVGS